MFYSLGFSCHSRFCLDELILDHTSNPFDYTISTKNFILRYLKSIRKDDSDQNFFEDYSSSRNWSLHTMPKEGTDGVLLGNKKNGIYMWHSFKREGPLTVENWRDATPEAISKYNFLFSRFAKRLKSNNGSKKVFLISNVQHNLEDFGKKK